MFSIRNRKPVKIKDTESKACQTKKAVKSFITAGFFAGLLPSAKGFGYAFHAFEEEGRDKLEECGTLVGVLSPTGWIPAFASAGLCALVSPAYAAYVHLGRSQTSLSDDDLTWLNNRGKQLVSEFDAEQLKSFSDVLKTSYQPGYYRSSGSSKKIAVALGFKNVEFAMGQSGGTTRRAYDDRPSQIEENDFSFEDKKKLVINYITNYQNNQGKKLFYSIFNTLKILDPKPKLEEYLLPELANIVLEYSA